MCHDAPTSTLGAVGCGTGRGEAVLTGGARSTYFHIEYEAHFKMETKLSRLNRRGSWTPCDVITMSRREQYLVKGVVSDVTVRYHTIEWNIAMWLFFIFLSNCQHSRVYKSLI